MRFVFLLLLSAAQAGWCQTSNANEEDFSKLSWLEGTWIRTNSKPGRSGTERWVMGKGKELHGWGVTMRGTDTAFVEKFSLLARNGRLYYVADVPENKQPVDFLITSIDSDGFVSENPQHDFPKKISYRRNGEKVRAVISGDGKEMEFLFERQKH